MFRFIFCLLWTFRSTHRNSDTNNFLINGTRHILSEARYAVRVRRQIFRERDPYVRLLSCLIPSKIPSTIFAEEEKPAAMHGGDRRNSTAATSSSTVLTLVALLIIADVRRCFRILICHATWLSQTDTRREAETRREKFKRFAFPSFLNGSKRPAESAEIIDRAQKIIDLAAHPEAKPKHSGNEIQAFVKGEMWQIPRWDQRKTYLQEPKLKVRDSTADSSPRVPCIPSGEI